MVTFKSGGKYIVVGNTIVGTKELFLVNKFDNNLKHISSESLDIIKAENLFTGEIIWECKEEFRRKIYDKLRKFSIEHDGDKINWEKYPLYCIEFDYSSEKIVIATNYCIKSFGEIYFYTKEIAEKAVDFVGKDNLIKYFKM